MSEPKLQLAMEEIKAVLKRHDLGGAAMLVSSTGGEHWIELEASWSKAKFNPVTGELRITARLADFGGDKEKWVDAVTSTVHLIQCLKHFGNELITNTDIVLQMMAQKIEIEGGPRPDKINPKN